MTTIDHAAEARRVLNRFPQENPLSIPDALARAQVHATLALVEQQRIANIIALSVPQQPLGSDKDVSVLIPSFDKEFNLRDDIKKGLGL
jgi:hypothetical protein